MNILPQPLVTPESSAAKLFAIEYTDPFPPDHKTPGEYYDIDNYEFLDSFMLRSYRAAVDEEPDRAFVDLRKIADLMPETRDNVELLRGLWHFAGFNAVLTTYSLDDIERHVSIGERAGDTDTYPVGIANRVAPRLGIRSIVMIAKAETLGPNGFQLPDQYDDEEGISYEEANISAVAVATNAGERYFCSKIKPEFKGTPRTTIDDTMIGLESAAKDDDSDLLSSFEPDSPSVLSEQDWQAIEQLHTALHDQANQLIRNK